MGESDVRSLGREECRELLKQGGLGRLAAAFADKVDIFPVNFGSDGSSIFFRTTAGMKLVELTLHADVAFEIDGYSPDAGWSVVAHGKARQLATADEIAQAEATGIDSWMPTPKDRYVRIDIERLTGLRFHRVAQTDADLPPAEGAS